MSDKTPMTIHGAEMLKQELHDLKFNQRPTVIKAIATAREHGDLKENAEYHAAREQQSFLEGRLAEIESKLSHAQIIDISSLPQNGKVIFGSNVTLLNVETDENITYRIVGDDEASVKDNKISYSSPIARAVIGKQEGDDVIVVTPGGEVEYEIEKVDYT